MSCEAMQENLTRRLAGDLPADEAAALARHLDECEACRAAETELGALWSELGELPDEAPPASVRQRFEILLAAEVERERRSRPLPFRGRAAEPPETSHPASPWRRLLPIAATLAFGFSLGWLFFGRGSTDDVVLNDLQKEVGELHELVALSLLQKSSVSDRLQGVAYSREQSVGDDRIAAALVRTLSEDSNVNVRLAALEALRPVAGRDDYRRTLVAVAARPDSPLVSLSVIDVLLESDTPAARRDLEQLMNDPNLEPVVRGYLRDRLGRSI
jgi:hypothetical protein